MYILSKSARSVFNIKSVSSANVRITSETHGGVRASSCVFRSFECRRVSDFRDTPAAMRRTNAASKIDFIRLIFVVIIVITRAAFADAPISVAEVLTNSSIVQNSEIPKSIGSDIVNPRHNNYNSDEVVMT